MTNNQRHRAGERKEEGKSSKHGGRNAKDCDDGSQVLWWWDYPGSTTEERN